MPRGLLMGKNLWERDRYINFVKEKFPTKPYQKRVSIV